MRKPRLGAVSLLVLGIGGCGPAPVPDVPPTPTATVQPAVTATATATASADQAPIAEPTDIVAIGRWRNPMLTATNLASCAGVTPVLVEVNARMGVNMILDDVLRRSADTRKIAALVALDAPVDILVTLDPQAKVRPPLIAVSVGMTSLDGAKAVIAPEGQELKELAPGVWRLKGERGVACSVAASAGATPARLVCAEREKTLEALAPYLARAMPSVDLGGPDVHLEARVDTLRKRYGTALQGYLRSFSGAFTAEYGTGQPKVDALLFEAATGVQEDMDKLLGDLQRVTAEVKSERSGTCLRATADIDLSSRTSWLAATLTDRMERSAAPPAIYWRQPKDSALALYGRGLDPARFTGVLAKARALVEASLAAENLGSAADRKKIADALDLPFGKDTNVVFSHGSTSVTMPELKGKDGPVKVTEASLARAVGWTLLGADEGPAAMKKQLKAMVDAYKLGSVQAALKKEMGSDAKSLPVIKSTAAPASLGAGAEAIEIAMPNVTALAPAQDGKKTPTMTYKMYVIVMGDGEASWMAIGPSKDDLVKRLLAVKRDADDKAQLGSRAGLEALKSGKQMFGGFVSGALLGDKAAAYIDHLQIVEPTSLNDEEVKLGRAIVGMPNRGSTPLLVTMNAAPNGTGARVSIALDAQQGTFEDMRALVVSSYGFWRRLGLLP